MSACAGVSYIFKLSNHFGYVIETNLSDPWFHIDLRSNSFQSYLVATLGFPFNGYSYLNTITRSP